MVYEILHENDMCQYYDFNNNPGVTPKTVELPERFAYLDDAQIQQQLLDFKDDKIAKVTLYIPSIHCSSCLWLLENLFKLNSAILDSKVNFLRKEVSITYQHLELNLRKVVELLAAIGYEPTISLDSGQSPADQHSNRKLYTQIGVAGFCFGNIMLLSFPEYLDIGNALSPAFRRFFGGLNILLALPVLLYSARDYLVSAWNGLRHQSVNIDVPLSLGILTMFTRSLYDIFMGNGSGYMDTFSGLVFFLLLGKLFQQKTYDNLSFERDYKSFFPISITRRGARGDTTIPLAKLTVGDRILVRHHELIPADAVLINGSGQVDYSFVTGEADPVYKNSGDLIYAGGRQIGSAIELEVVKAVSQSYLTQLWNNDTFDNAPADGVSTFANGISKYFTLAILCIAFLAAIYWLPTDFPLALNAFTAVLIIACPCALALSTPFTLGNVQRIFGRHQFYLKNTGVLEKLAKITAIVFDKTGTITHARHAKAAFVSLNGQPHLNATQLTWVKSLVRQTTHPLSLTIFNSLKGDANAPVSGFRELPGSGISAEVDGHSLKLGSATFVGKQNAILRDNQSTVFVEIDGKTEGYFSIANVYREGFPGLVSKLKNRFRLSLISGDNDREKSNLEQFLGRDTDLRFDQSPQQKLDYVKNLQARRERVLMIGDGLNDAGALKQSDVGIAVTEDLNSFSPACDGILQAQQFTRLDQFLKFSRVGMRIIYANLVFSLLYNVIGLSFAVTGTLSPVICAVLMPISSISVIAFSTIITNVLAKFYGFGSKPKTPGDDILSKPLDVTALATSPLPRERGTFSSPLIPGKGLGVG